MNTWFLNAGDSWQVSQKLNVNYGIRYGMWAAAQRLPEHVGLPAALTASNGLAFQGKDIDSLYGKYWKSFSPRVGVSYAADPEDGCSCRFLLLLDTPNLNPFRITARGSTERRRNWADRICVHEVPVGRCEDDVVKNVRSSFVAELSVHPTSTCGVFRSTTTFVLRTT